MQMSVCVYYGSVVCAHLDVVDLTIVLQDSSTATNHLLHSSHLFVVIFFTDVSDHSLLIFCAVGPSADAVCIFCYSGLTGFSIGEARGFLEIFLQPSTDIIRTTLVFKSCCSTNLKNDDVIGHNCTEPLW